MKLVVRSVDPRHRVGLTCYPDELLESRYIICRDEMMWRKYCSLMSQRSDEGESEALRVLRMIREASN